MAKSPLHSNHINLGAKMVDFHGWELPLHYGSQLNEHHAVRNAAGIFDVSHMTVVDVLGAGGRQFLRKLLTNDVDQLTRNGGALYSCMCNENGGIIDDLIIYQRAPDYYRLVLNSATREQVLPWLRKKITGFSAGLQERNDLAMVAIQGPQAISKLLSILSPAQADPVSTLMLFECVEVEEYFFASTGYTGEDGLEIILPIEKISALWQSLIDIHIQPCGLAARDTLRLEAGMMLYGQDMDTSTTPLESGLSWTVKWQPEDRDFIGMGALISQKQHGIKRKMVGLILEDKGIMRSGHKVIVEGVGEGIITSGTFSPTLSLSIALARVPVATEEKVKVSIRDKHLNARVVKPRFVKNNTPLF
jgi:aminomethyltransferase